MNASSADAMITLGALGDYKAQLVHVLMEPPIAPEDLPPNVPPPEGEFPGGLQDRFQVVGLNHFALEEAGLVVVQVEVTTTSGTYTAVGEVHAELPWRVTTGLRNVPIGIPVLLHGKDQAAYDWELTPPAGSAAVLTDATTQNPELVPDVAGTYERVGDRFSDLSQAHHPRRLEEGFAVGPVHDAPACSVGVHCQSRRGASRNPKQPRIRGA